MTQEASPQSTFSTQDLQYTGRGGDRSRAGTGPEQAPEAGWGSGAGGVTGATRG